MKNEIEQINIEIALLKAELKSLDGIHGIYFFLSLITLGGFVPVWIIHAIVNRQSKSKVERKIAIYQKMVPPVKAPSVPPSEGISTLAGTVWIIAFILLCSGIGVLFSL